MIESLNKLDKELYGRIDEILFFQWDPLGVSYAVEVRDEYRTYTPKIYSLLKNSAIVTDIARELKRLENEWMGVAINEQQREEVAEILPELGEFYKEKAKRYQ